MNGYVPIRELGKRSFGKVCLVENKQKDGLKFKKTTETDQNFTKIRILSSDESEEHNLYTSTCTGSFWSSHTDEKTNKKYPRIWVSCNPDSTMIKLPLYVNETDQNLSCILNYY